MSIYIKRNNMSKKIKINEQQLELIVNYIKENENPIVIKENELIEEGWKEIVLGAALLLGANLTSAQTEKADQLLQNADVLKQVETTLENDTEIEKLANYFKMDKSDLENYMQRNADKIEAEFDKYADKDNVGFKLDITDPQSARSAKSKIQTLGYAIKSIEITNDTILPEGAVVDTIVKDTVEFDYSAENMFITASFDLKPEIKKELKETINQIIDGGGEIFGVEIESSTDTEPIEMGNERLAQLRAESVESELRNMGISVDIQKDIKPEQGPDVYSTDMSSAERDAARNETQEYRYVKVKFFVLITVQDSSDGENPVLPQIKETIRVELAKASTWDKTGGGYTFTGKSSTTKKAKCLKVKYKGQKLKCSFQN